MEMIGFTFGWFENQIITLLRETGRATSEPQSCQPAPPMPPEDQTTRSNKRRSALCGLDPLPQSSRWRELRSQGFWSTQSGGLSPPDCYPPPRLVVRSQLLGRSGRLHPTVVPVAGPVQRVCPAPDSNHRTTRDFKLSALGDASRPEPRCSPASRWCSRRAGRQSVPQRRR